MAHVAYHLFETSLGWCGMAWREAETPEIVAFQLPEMEAEVTETRIAAKSGGKAAGALPAQVAQIIERIEKHLDGEMQDFRDVPVALGKTGDFARRVYVATRDIPTGQTRSYGEIAAAAGNHGAARAVGQALGKNPVALIIPCHRVLAAGGKAGGFTAHGGLNTKARLLAAEGVALRRRV